MANVSYFWLYNKHIKMFMYYSFSKLKCILNSFEFIFLNIYYIINLLYYLYHIYVYIYKTCWHTTVSVLEVFQVEAILPSKIHYINSTQTFVENYNMLNPEIQAKDT